MGSVLATYSPLQACAAPQLDALQLAQICSQNPHGFPQNLMGSVQATYSPLQAGAAPQLDALQLAQMCAMGFPRTHAQHALAATNCSGAHAWLQAAPAAIQAKLLRVP